MAEMTRHDPYAALRHRDYRLFAGGAVLSNISSAMMETAVGWELYERTGSAVPLALSGLVQALPVFALALPAGQVADRFERRRIAVTMQLIMSAMALCLAALSYMKGPVGGFYLCLLIGAMARAFNFPAQASLLPQLVPLESFSNAVTWRSSGFQLASVIGPALAGVLIAWRHEAVWVYLLSVALTLTFAVCLLLIRKRQAAVLSEPLTLHSSLAGARFVWRTKVILAAITLDMFAVLLGGATALLPIYAKDILHVGPSGLGWLRAAPGIGALVMALAIAHARPPQRAGRTLLWAVAGFGVATIVFGLSRIYWLSLLMLAFTGALDNISVVVRHTLVQVLTPDAMRGRVSAVNSLFIITSNELGAFESGAVAALAGAVFSVVFGGIGTIVVVALAALAWPELRRLGALQQTKS
jgi:MFS family permease